MRECSNRVSSNHDRSRRHSWLLQTKVKYKVGIRHQGGSGMRPGHYGIGWTLRERKGMAGVKDQAEEEEELGSLPATVDFPLGLGHAHEHFNVLDRNPTGQDLHAVFEIGLQDNVSHAVN